MTVNEKRSLVGIVMFMPFAISATWEFLPAWVAVPSTFVGIMLWIGSLLTIHDEKKEQP